MNERTHCFIEISLTLYSRKGWCWLCVRGELDTGTDSYILTPSSSDHSSTSSSSFWVAQPWVTEGPKPSVCRSLLIRHLVTKGLQLQLELTQAVCSTWLYNCLMSTCLRCSSLIYTGASLDWRLGRGSIYNKSTGDSLKIYYEWRIWKLCHQSYWCSYWEVLKKRDHIRKFLC